MANQNDSGLGSGLNDPSGIGGLTGSAGMGGSTGFDSTRSTSTGAGSMDSDSFGTGSFGASSTGTSDETSQDAAGRARELASNLRSRATEKVEESISEQKYRAADSLGTIAQQIRSAGEQFPQDNPVGRYISQAAGQVDNIASFLNNRDVADLMDEVEQLARRQPAVFIGGAFALGVLGARFLKSSRRNVGYDYQDRWSSRESSDMLDMPRDSVNRPNAPGYSPATDRMSTGYGATGSSMGTDSYGGAGASTGLGGSGVSGTGASTGLGGSGLSGSGTSTGLGGSGLSGSGASTGLGGSGLGSTGTGSSGLGSTGTSGSGMGDTGFGSTGSGTRGSGYGASGSSTDSDLGGSGSGAL